MWRAKGSTRGCSVSRGGRGPTAPCSHYGQKTARNCGHKNEGPAWKVVNRSCIKAYPFLLILNRTLAKAEWWSWERLDWAFPPVVKLRLQEGHVGIGHPPYYGQQRVQCPGLQLGMEGAQRRSLQYDDTQAAHEAV